MKIAFLSPHIGWTQGVAHYVAALSTELAHRHEVHVFAAGIETAAFAGVRLHRVPVLPWGAMALHASFLASYPFSYLWHRLIDKKRFDIVHGQGTFSPLANVLTAHFIQAREPLMFPRQPQGENGRPFHDRVERWDTYFYDQMAARLERYSRHTLSAKTVIAISRSVKDDLLHDFDAPPERVVVVPNGVDVERFHPRNQFQYRRLVRRQLGLEEDDIVALFVGNYWERKGLGACVRAVRSCSDDRLKLLVVGDGDPAGFVTDEERGSADRRFVFISRRVPDVERYFAAADFLLFPTRYEPFGLVILEALASGLPVVTSIYAGASEYITHGETGLLLQDPTDAVEVAGLLRLLLDAPDLRVRLGCNGRRLATQFTWQRIASKTEEAYESALGLAGRTRLLA